MINRYQGNSGRLTHYPEPERPRPPAPQRPGPSAPQRPVSHAPQRPAPVPPRPTPQRPQGLLCGLENLSRGLPERIGELETEDIILLLILYLMYRESGDSDLLIIMGAMFLL